MKMYLIKITYVKVGKVVYKGQSKKEAMNLLEKAISNGDTYKLETKISKRLD